MNQHFAKLGWVISAVVAATMISGFQGKTDKVGVVDISHLLNDSDLAKGQIDEIRGIYQRRKDLLEFVSTYTVFTQDQAKRFRELGTKAVLTGPEKTEFEKIKSDVMAADKQYKDLTTKANLTAADTARLQDLGRLQQETNTLLSQWTGEFDAELKDLQAKQQTDNLQKTREAINTIGKAQSFSLIFVKDAAAYGANDVTPDVLKALNKK